MPDIKLLLHSAPMPSHNSISFGAAFRRLSLPNSRFGMLRFKPKEFGLRAIANLSFKQTKLGRYSSRKLTGAGDTADGVPDVSVGRAAKSTKSAYKEIGQAQ